MPTISPLAAFEDNIQDAIILVNRAKFLSTIGMRKLQSARTELVCDFLKIPKRDRGDVLCLENDHLFFVIKKDVGFGLDEMKNADPLYRQAIVAGCAALESYVADIMIQHLDFALGLKEPSSKLTGMPITLREWHEIDSKYVQGIRGVKKIIRENIKKSAGPSSASVGYIMSMMQLTGWSTKVDNERKLTNGVTTVAQLDMIANRRNVIAHSGDRGPRNTKAPIDAKTVDEYLQIIKSIVEALDKVIKTHVNDTKHKEAQKKKEARARRSK